jgi:hypothetical protein
MPFAFFLIVQGKETFDSSARAGLTAVQQRALFAQTDNMGVKRQTNATLPSQNPRRRK